MRTPARLTGRALLFWVIAAVLAAVLAWCEARTRSASRRGPPAGEEQEIEILWGPLDAGQTDSSASTP